LPNVKTYEEDIDLRSTTVSTSLSRLLAFFPNITTSGTCTGTACAVCTHSRVRWWGILHIFISFVIIAARSVPVKIPQFSSNINRLTRFQHAVHNVAQLQIARAEPVVFAIGMLGFGLQPK
jgi:hypothetical protein